jgi:predicted metal-binding membrane protein
MIDHQVSAPLPDQRASAGVLISVLGLAAASWLIAMAQMRGMDMGTATDLGSFGHFLALWTIMMAAMMLPGTARYAARAVPSFLFVYLALWAAAGVFAYVAYRPHGTAAAGAVVLIAGLYELTPLARRCRERCHQRRQSGLGFGIACLGSSIGLMAILLAISPMSIAWMAVIAAAIVVQKMLPATWPIDPLFAVVIVGLGVWILTDPSSVPGLMPPM